MKNILLVATGSVAVVKFKKIRDLLLEDFNVKVISTEYVKRNYKNSSDFNAITEENDLESFPMHIEHAKWADLIVVAPATANTLAKFNAGIADSQVLSTLIAARNPILFVPAMNNWMYDAISKRGVLDSISKLGHMFLGPTTGMLREGEIGLGRMVEPEEIHETVKNYFKNNKIVLMPYGASKVKIDPVRYITNGSTGTMARHLENELKLLGYKVLSFDISKMSNEEFIEKALELDFDIYISPAAFADFDVKESLTKIKKGTIDSLKLINNKDVITSISSKKPNKKYFAFKLDDSKQNAINKMNKLNLDGIIWNKIGSMGSDKVTGEIITKEGNKSFNSISKLELAKLIARIL